MKNPIPIPPALRAKWLRLNQLLAEFDRLAIAYSGGVDSTFLVWVVAIHLGRQALVMLAVSPLVSAREREEARRLAQQLGFAVEEVQVDLSGEDPIWANPPNRCYGCKKTLFSELLRRAQGLNYPRLADGTNVDDLRTYRPGLQALRELNVMSPLALAGFTKVEIRELSRLVGLSTWNKPSMACLATRIPYGTRITGELLAAIEQAEESILNLGCSQVRVRVHGRLARIEVHPEDFPRLLEAKRRAEILERFRQLGFPRVSLDLAGYSSGSMDLLGP
jgi:pyridinium-3,5-biscarboxylic acid mononucleotide sulfurtransferase